MKAGRASRTAELVCMGRAVSDGRWLPGRYSDPTALKLLSPADQERVEKVRRGKLPLNPLKRLGAAYMTRQAALMVARTLRIDDAIREARHPQLVILGAGLDGRPYRMKELEGVSVFEIDHPDTQRDKRQRAAALTPTTKDLRYVAVDFERDSLDEALEKAGHDRTRPTTWVWEGVVMYLAPSDVDATLGVIERHSAPGSRAIVNYHSPSLLRPFVGLFVRAVGEPLKSHYQPAAMQALLAGHQLKVKSDESLFDVGTRLDAKLAEVIRNIGHLRIAIADRT